MSKVPFLFRDLAIGQEFDFIDDNMPGFNSYFERCRKISERRYVPVELGDRPYLISIMQVGSINAHVFHVGPLAE